MSSLARGIISMIGLALSAVIVLMLVPTGPRGGGGAGTRAVEGVVAELSTPCCGDVVLRLKGDGRTYYIQGALGPDADLGAWGRGLIDQSVTLTVPKVAWSEDRPAQQMVPVSRIALGESVFYPAPR